MHLNSKFSRSPTCRYLSNGYHPAVPSPSWHARTSPKSTAARATPTTATATIRGRPMHRHARKHGKIQTQSWAPRNQHVLLCNSACTYYLIYVLRPSIWLSWAVKRHLLQKNTLHHHCCSQAAYSWNTYCIMSSVLGSGWTSVAPCHRTFPMHEAAIEFTHLTWHLTNHLGKQNLHLVTKLVDNHSRNSL